MSLVTRWALAVALLVGFGSGAAALTLADAGSGQDGGGLPAPRPVVDHQRLVDSRTGREFVPRGVTWSSFEYACAQGWGLSTLDLLPGADPAADEAGAIAAWGATTVRLPLNQDCWLGTRGAPVSDAQDERTAQDYRAAVGGFVDTLNRAGLVVVLDLHSRKRLGADEYGSLAMPDSESLVFWSSVATAFRDHPSVLFEAFDSPGSRTDAAGRRVFDPSWLCWRDGGCEAPVEDGDTTPHGGLTFPAQGMDRIVRTIRDAGARQPILLPGLADGTDLTHWRELAPEDDQLVAAFHLDGVGACVDARCWDSVVAPLADVVPVVTTDLRPSDPEGGDLAPYLAWARRHQIGTIFWVWAAHDNDPVSLIRGSGSTPSPYGELVRSFFTGSTRKPWSEPSR
ncbi:cellulase family glycosylhydrolase [Nocardioides sp.]|uniref:cellulase family glycosylhydrolase n=1 Tax=Nocardioides sp. TaxID=35761 RepID=UPI00286CE486|nr:cellulase family glycosylhydrolase [Nocardioides sp.]